MAGVAGPLLRESRPAGLRFLAGLVIGSLLTGLVLALVLVVTGSVLTALPLPVRVTAAAVFLVALAWLDLLNRTPHVWRQVPQRLVRELPPGQLGVIWGADLGTLISTQKTTSLIWGAIAVCVLVRPGTAVALAVLVSVVATLVIGASSHLPAAGQWRSTVVRARVPEVRRMAGVLLALSAVGVLVGAL